MKRFTSLVGEKEAENAMSTTRLTPALADT